jgi:GNAT superfamily N-acetyltransferase
MAGVIVVVRRAGRSDAERLARINIDAWRAAYTGIVTPALLDDMRLDHYVETWRSRLTDDDSPERVVLVGEIDGTVATYCAGGPYRPQTDAADDDTKRWGEIYAIYTHPSQQEHGAGSAVHEAFLDRLSRQGYETAALWVLRANASGRRWYANRGWRPDGATTDWVSTGVVLPEIRLRLNLTSP